MGRWVTLEGGQKVFIRDGEMLSDALERLRPSKYKVNFESGIKEEDKDLVNKRLKRLMFNVPERDIRGLKEIRIVEEADFEWRGNKFSASASYNSSEKRVTIESQFIYSDDKIVKEILYHEVGHHLVDKLPLRQRVEWSKLYVRGINHGYKFPTEYAVTNKEEGFAECYGYYRSKREKEMDSIFVKWFKENIG